MTELLTAIENSAASVWLRESNSIWAYPTVLTLHTIGLALLVGANAALDLRVLGVARAISVADLQPLMRWMWIGFWVNALSGAVLLAADATTKVASPMFLIKLGLVAAGVVVLRALDRRIYGPDAVPGIIPPAARALAMASLAIWFLAIAAGRLMAYPGLVLRHLTVARHTNMAAWIVTTLKATTLSHWMIQLTWLWPLCETLHFVGLALLIGVVGLLDLRLLGFFRRASGRSGSRPAAVGDPRAS